jgi:hypothetical protein
MLSVPNKPILPNVIMLSVVVLNVVALRQIQQHLLLLPFLPKRLFNPAIQAVTVAPC